jgi:hypothetical protein
VHSNSPASRSLLRSRDQVDLSAPSMEVALGAEVAARLPVGAATALFEIWRNKGTGRGSRSVMLLIVAGCVRTSHSQYTNGP